MRTFCVCLALLCWLTCADAARTVYSEGAITIKLEMGQVTAMIFPEEVSTVTTAIPEARLKISKDNAYVGFVLIDPELPRNRQIVTGLSGRVYLVYVEAAKPGQPGDDLVYVSHKAPTVQADILSPLSVLRRLRSPNPGPAQPVTISLPTTQDTRIVLRQPQQYTMGPYQALVLPIENVQDVTLLVDERVGVASPEAPLTVRLQDWAWPPKRRLLAVAVESQVIAPHTTTLLYAVFEEMK